VLASEVTKRGLGNFVTDLRLINSLAGNLEVDQGLSATHMANLVLEFHDMNPNRVPQYTLPVVEDSREYFYRGGGYGSVVFPIQPEDARVVAQFLGTALGEDSSGQPLPSPSSFTVAVENGSGVYEKGAKTSASLEALGYRVTSVTNTEVGASTTETTVLYSDPSKRADALRVQSALSGLAIIGYDPGLLHTETGRSGSSTSGTAGSGGTSSGGAGSASTLDVGSPLPASEAADVVVVVGSNFAVNSPAGSTSTSTTAPRSLSTASGVPYGGAGPSTTTTTVPAPLSNNPALAAPSSSTETLEPWDPRSCTATGGEGP
jgi:hypothetical protein